MHTSSTAVIKTSIPVVVHLGFAGARKLFDPVTHSDLDVDQFNATLVNLLVAQLGQLRRTLGLDEPYFLCGVSALATGADTLFTRACQQMAWPQRLLLPQQRGDFLAGVGNSGTLDFAVNQRAEAEVLFQSSHIIEERVASGSRERAERFQDVNSAIVELADVLVCLLPENASAGKPGGTEEFLQLAKDNARPVLELRLKIDETGEPTFKATWHQLASFQRPAPPEAIADAQIPSTSAVGLETYCALLKTFSSNYSKLRQRWFNASALTIIGTHVFATLVAVFALKLGKSPALPWLLGVELVLLIAGLATHQYLHSNKAIASWAMARLVAETARSYLALQHMRAPVSHMTTLLLPSTLRALVRTLEVLHLRDAKLLSADTWLDRRETYLTSRLTVDSSSDRGQIAYYRDECARAQRQHRFAYRCFLLGSLGALVATGAKFGLALVDIEVPINTLLGIFAVVLPVVAVAAMSLAASRDLEARAHTFQEMHDFLTSQQLRLRLARSEQEFNRLALETEARLLGETASWYFRRAFTGVA